MKKKKTISEMDRRLLQSGKHLFSCNVPLTLSDKLQAMFYLVLIG